jgi:hypothetical protein
MQMYGVYAETPFFIDREKNTPLIYFFSEKEKMVSTFLFSLQSQYLHTLHTLHTLSIKYSNNKGVL